MVIILLVVLVALLLVLLVVIVWKAKHIEANLRERESIIHKKEKFYDKLKRVDIKYCVSESDLNRFSTPETIERHVKDYMARQIVSSIDFYVDENVSISTSTIGTNIYTLTYYIIK